MSKDKTNPVEWEESLLLTQQSEKHHQKNGGNNGLEHTKQDEKRKQECKLMKMCE